MQKVELASYNECSSLLELLKVRDANADTLFKDDNIFATAVGYKWKHSKITNIPAVLVFVSEKTDKPIVPIPAVLYNEKERLWCATDVLPGFVNGLEELAVTDDNKEITAKLHESGTTITGGAALYQGRSYGTTSCVLKGNGDGEFYALSNNHVVSRPDSVIKFKNGTEIGKTVESATVCELNPDLPDTPCAQIDVGVVKLNKDIKVAPGTYMINDGLEEPTLVDESTLDIIGTRVWGCGATSGHCEGYIAAYSFSEKTKMKSKIASFLIVQDKAFFSRPGDSGMLLLAKGNGSDVANKPVGLLFAGWNMKLRQNGTEDWTYAMGMGPIMKQLNLKPEQFSWKQ